MSKQLLHDWKNIWFLKKIARKNLHEKWLDYKDPAKNNLLHLALLYKQKQLATKLFRYTRLLIQENTDGLTPKMLAAYLSYPGGIRSYEKPIQIEKEGITTFLSIQEFEKMMEIKYLHHLEFQKEKIFFWVLRNSKKACLTHFINLKQKWLGAYYAEDLHNFSIADLILKWMGPVKEYGLVAGKDLQKDAYIGEYTGVVRRFHKIKDQKNPYCFEYSLGEMQTPFTIDAREKGNLIRYINHSANPNIYPNFIYADGIIHVIFRSKRPIQKGEELTYDYGPNYWAQREKPIE